MPNYAVGSGVNRGTQYVLKASGAETTSTTGGAVNIGDNGGPMYLAVVVTASAGTTPTLTVVVEGSNDGTNFFSLGTVGADGYVAGSSASGVTAPSNFTTTATVRAAFPAMQYVRTRSVIGGSAGQSFTYSVSAVVG